MKILNIFILVASFIIWSANPSLAQNTKKKEAAIFKVEGACGMCKKRIENSLSIKGVKMAEWDVHSKMLRVVYVPSKISEQKIHETIAALGHDTSKVKAKDEVYEKLHGCCKYRK